MPYILRRSGDLSEAQVLSGLEWLIAGGEKPSPLATCCRHHIQRENSTTTPRSKTLTTLTGLTTLREFYNSYPARCWVRHLEKEEGEISSGAGGWLAGGWADRRMWRSLVLAPKLILRLNSGPTNWWKGRICEMETVVTFAHGSRQINYQRKCYLWHENKDGSDIWRIIISRLTNEFSFLLIHGWFLI